MMMMMMMTMTINNMPVSSLDLSHNNLAQMTGIHFAVALVGTTMLMTVMRRKRIVMILTMMMVMNSVFPGP